MAFTAGTLADGQVAASVGAIYTASAPVVLKFVNFFNAGSANETLSVYITRNGGTRRQVIKQELAVDQALAFLSEGETLTLSSGDLLEAEATTGSAVDYIISGAADA